jgi:hypothetical protein
MKLTMMMTADDVTAMVDALEDVRDKVESGATIGKVATDEWYVEFEVVASCD